MRRGLYACALTASLLVGSATFSPAVAADRPDAWLTAKTQIALMTTEGVDTTDLNVDTAEGVVTLHGKVSSEAGKAKAEQVARSIDGVKEVKNLLQVVPEEARESVGERDENIRERLDEVFDENEALAESDIVVASVNDGVVLLSGKTDDLQLHLEAIEAARSVRGVRRVASEVYVAPAHGE